MRTIKVDAFAMDSKTKLASQINRTVVASQIDSLVAADQINPPAAAGQTNLLVTLAMPLKSEDLDKPDLLAVQVVATIHPFVTIRGTAVGKTDAAGLLEPTEEPGAN